MLTETIRRLIDEEMDRMSFNMMLVEIDQITQAKDLARDVHKGQWRKSTPVPYIVHPLRVFHRAKKRGMSKKIQILAILHDTYEDSRNPQKTIKQVQKIFGTGIVKLIKILSHDKGIDYKEYLLKLSSYSTAFEVKLLDMEDNLIDKPSDKQKKKYREALEYLVEHGVKINPKLLDSLIKLTRK